MAPRLQPGLHFRLDDANLGDRLRKLGSRQPHPLSRNDFIYEVLKLAAGADCHTPEQVAHRLDRIAQTLPVPSTRQQLVNSILKAAIADGRGAPIDKWVSNVTSFMKRLEDSSHTPPSSSDATSMGEATPGASPSPPPEAARQEQQPVADAPAVKSRRRRAG